MKNKDKIAKIINEAVKIYFDYPGVKIGQAITKAKDVVDYRPDVIRS